MHSVVYWAAYWFPFFLLQLLGQGGEDEEEGGCHVWCSFKLTSLGGLIRDSVGGSSLSLHEQPRGSFRFILVACFCPLVPLSVSGLLRGVNNFPIALIDETSILLA